MKKTELDSILAIMCDKAARVSKYHGVQYYEHDRNGHWRACPEQFAVHAVHDELRRQGYSVTAEAHQGGIWTLCDKKKNMPKNSDKRRYDLAIWGKKRPPDVLCEFKSGYSISPFHKDTEDLRNARLKLGVETVLGLIGVRDDKEKLKALLARERQIIESCYGLSALARSKAFKTPRYFCGEHYDDEYSFTKHARKTTYA